MSDVSKIVYWAETLPGDRAQLYRDVIVHGEVRPELSGPIGSPGPQRAVFGFERVVTLDTKTTDIGDLGDQLLLDSLTQPDAP